MRYTRTTISLPPELRKKMDAVQGVNWSAEAAKAFRNVLIRLRAGTYTPAMTVEERLARLEKLLGLEEP